MRPARIVLFVGAAMLASAPPVVAQPAPEPPPRFETMAQVTVLATTGNSSTRSLGLGGDMTYRNAPWVYAARAVFAQNEDTDVLKARSFVALFRASRSLTPRLSAYGQYDYLRDRFAGVEHRSTVEGGLSYLVVDRAPHRLRVDGGAGYLQEVRLGAEDFDSAIGSLGAGYRWTISETSEFTDDARYILTFADVGAWKIDQVAALTLAIRSIFSLRVSNTIRFANEPVPGFERTDTMTAGALVMKIRRP